MKPEMRIISLELRAPNTLTLRDALMRALDVGEAMGMEVRDVSTYVRTDREVLYGPAAPELPPAASTGPAPEPAADPSPPSTRPRRAAKPAAEAPAPEPAAAPSAPAEPPAAEPPAEPEGPTIEDLRAAAQTLIDAGKGSKLKPMLLDLGVASMSDVPPGEREGLLAKLREAAKG